jgi:hypothetical protein
MTHPEADRLNELAERVERASGPDRELDCAVFLAVWPGGRALSRPPFTASLDAAMTLVDLEVGADGYGHGYYPYIERTASLSGPTGWSVTLAHCFERYRAKAATPALALCAAALRAHALSNHQDTEVTREGVGE